MSRPAAIAAVAAVSALAGLALAAAPASVGWPQWRGPNRDGVSTETGLQQSWKPGGPAVVWKASGLGTGYSSVAVAGGRVFTMGDVGGAQQLIASGFGPALERGIDPLWRDAWELAWPRAFRDAVAAAGREPRAVRREGETQDRVGVAGAGARFARSELVPGASRVTSGAPGRLTSRSPWRALASRSRRLRHA